MKPRRLDWRLLALAALGLGACTLISGIESGEPQCPVDGVKNGLEIDVDCGGPCAPCPAGATCTSHADCADNACLDDYLGCDPEECPDAEHFCWLPDCSDDRVNGEETDLDCGGPDCDRCYGGDACIQDSDCAAQALAPAGQSCIDGFCKASCCFDDCWDDQTDDEGCCGAMIDEPCGPGLLGWNCGEGSGGAPGECLEPLDCTEDDDTGEETCY